MGAYQDAARRARNSLSQKHQQMLFEESANAPDVAAERGTFTAWTGKDVPQDGGKLPARPGLVFPVHTLDGDVFHRLRPNNPGRGPKYLQPKGHANRLDVHPRQHERIKQPGEMRYITEGEKKVDAGVSRGMLMVGVSGVFNGQRDKGAALIPDFDYLPMDGERYSILFDSDIETNPMVQLAADRQARRLRERGAEVFITLLPPAPDGSKQGLDDFFANGGTVKEIELLTRPYDSVDMGAVRLTRDEKLRAGIETLRSWWRETDWMGFVGDAERGNWARGHTARDVVDALLYFAARRGKPDERGIVFSVGTRAIAERAAKSAPSVAKSIKHLEAAGFLEVLPQEDRAKPRTYRLLVPSATLYSMEKRSAEGEGAGHPTEVGGHRCKGLRAPTAPRLRWSSPGRARRKEFEVVKGTKGRVRHAGQTPRNATAEDIEARPYVKRLGPHRCAVLDALEDAGGEMAVHGVADVLHRRARDLMRRRNPGSKGRDGLLIMLLDSGIITVVGDVVRLAADWLEKLEAERDCKGEIEQAKEQRKKHREDGARYRERLERAKHGPHGPSRAGLDLMRRGIENREKYIAAELERQEKARAALRERRRRAQEFVRGRVRALDGRIRLELLEGVLADAGFPAGWAGPAAQSLGCSVEPLAEFEDEMFVLAPLGWDASPPPSPVPDEQQRLAV